MPDFVICLGLMAVVTAIMREVRVAAVSACEERYRRLWCDMQAGFAPIRRDDGRAKELPPNASAALAFPEGSISESHVPAAPQGQDVRGPPRRKPHVRKVRCRWELRPLRGRAGGNARVSGARLRRTQASASHSRRRAFLRLRALVPATVDVDSFSGSAGALGTRMRNGPYRQPLVLPCLSARKIRCSVS